MGGFQGGLMELGATSLVTEVVIQVKDEATEGLTKLVADLHMVEDSALSMEARMRAGATAIADVGTALGVATLGVVAWSVAQASSFQHSSQALQSFVGVSSKDLAYYRDGLIRLSLDTGGSLSELTDNLIKVVQAGYKLGEALKITQIAQEAAIATHEQAVTAMGPLLSIMRAYTLAAGDAGAVMDDLIVASRDSGASFQAFATSLQRSATTAVGLGISYKDLLALTAELSQGQASMYRTGMIANQMLMGLKHATSDQNATAQLYKITLDDLTKAHKEGLLPMLEEIDHQIRRRAGDWGTAAEQTNRYREAVRQVIGQGPASDAYMRLEQQHFKGLTEEQLHLADALGTTARSFKSAEANYSDSLEAMEHRTQTLGVAIGTGLLPVLTALEQDVSDVVTPIAEFAYAHQDLTKIIVASVAAFTAVAVALRIVLGLHGLFSAAAALFAGGQTAEAAAMGRSATAAGALSEAQMVAATSMGVASAAADAEVVSLTALFVIQEALSKQNAGIPSSLPQKGTQIAEEAKNYAPQVVEDAAVPASAYTANKLARSAPVIEETAATSTAADAATLTQTVGAGAGTATEITGIGAAAAEAAPAVEGLALGLGTIASFAVGIGEVVAILAVLEASGALPHMRQDANDFSTGVFNLIDGIDKRKPIVGDFAVSLVNLANWLGDAGHAEEVWSHQVKASTSVLKERFDAHKAYFDLLLQGKEPNVAHAMVAQEQFDFTRGPTSATNLPNEDDRTAARLQGAVAYKDALNAARLIQSQTGGELSNQEVLQRAGLARQMEINSVLDQTFLAHKKITDAIDKANKATEKWYSNQLTNALALADAWAKFERTHDPALLKIEHQVMQKVDVQQFGKEGFTATDQTARSFDIGGGPALAGLRKTIEDLPPSMRAAMQQPLKDFGTAQAAQHATYLAGVKDLDAARHRSDLDAEKKYEMAMAQARKDEGTPKGVKEASSAAAALITAAAAADQTYKDGVKALQKTFDTAIDTLRHGLKTNTSDVGFGKTLESVIPAEETAAMEGLVGAIAKGSTALAGHVERVHQADIAQELLTQTLIKADKAVGHWGDALTKLTGDADKKLSDAMGHLTIDLHDHSGNIQADTAAAIHQQTERNKWTDAQTLATQKVTLATGDFAAKQSVVQAQSTTAAGKLADAFLTGKGNIDELGKRAAEAAEKVLKYSEAMAKAQLKSGDFSTAQTGAQTLSTIATGRVSQAERLGTGNLPELIEAARKASAVVDTFTVASAKAALAVGDFAQQTSAAQTLSTIALNKYAEGIYKGSAGLDLLEKAAIGAAETVFHLTEAQRIAAMHIAENVGSPASKLAARTAEAQGNLNDALAVGAEQIRLHGHMTAETSLAIGAAREKLYEFSNAAAKAAASGPPTDFTSGQAAAQARLTLSTNDLETAIMRGSGGLKELEASVAQAAQDVKNYAKIHREGLLDVARATGDYTAVVAEKAQDLKTKSDIATAALEHAVNTGAGNLGELAAAAARAAKFLDQHGQRSLEASILIDKAGHQWATAWEDQAKYLTNGEMKRAVNMAAQDIQQHGSVSRDAADQLARAYQAQEVITMKQATLHDAEDQALLTAALALGDFTTAVAQAAKIAKTAWDKAEAAVQSAVLDPNFRPKLPETPAQRHSQATRIAEGLPSDLPVAPTAMASALALLPAAADAMATVAFKASEAARIELPYRIEAAKKLGDWGQAVALSAELTANTAKRGSDEATAYFLGLGGSLSDAQGLIKAGAEANEKQYLATAATAKLVAQADIDAAVAAGDLGHAFDLLGAQLAKNLATDKSNIAGDVQFGRDPSKDLDQYRQDKIAQDGYNQSLITGSILVGDFAAAVSGISSKLSTDLANATGALTLSFYQTGQASDADIATAQAARIATEKFAQAQWDASFATASAAEQTKMEVARFSEMISHNSTIQGAQAAVNNAALAETAAEGAVTNALMAEQVTATNGIASILSAQTSLLSAISASQVSAIDDQTSIMQAEATLVSNQVQQQITLLGAVSTATVAEYSLMQQIGRDQLQVDRDAVEIAKTQAAMDRATNAAAVKLATDQLTLARDKADGDNLAASDAARLAMDHLAEARIQTKIALDSQKLALDQLSTLVIVASAVSEVNDFGTMISDDLGRLNQDAIDMFHAQQQTAADQQQASADAAAAAALQAQDNLLIGQDNAAAAALKDSYSLQLAELKQKQAADSAQKQRDDDHLKLLQAIAANTGVSAKAGMDAAKATIALLEKEMLRKRIGLDRTTVSNTGEASYLNSWASDAYKNGGLPSA